MSISYYEELCLPLMHLFCCANFDKADEMYNSLDGLMTVIMRTVARSKQNQGGSPTAAGPPWSWQNMKDCSRFWYPLTKLDIFSHCFYHWSGLWWRFQMTVFVLMLVIWSGRMVWMYRKCEEREVCMYNIYNTNHFVHEITT